jgi:hypothetical protein
VQWIRSTIDPRIGADDSSLWELQLRDLRLDSFVFQCVLLNHEYLCKICIAMQVGAETDICLNRLSGKIDDCFVKFVLQSYSAPALYFANPRILTVFLK